MVLRNVGNYLPFDVAQFPRNNRAFNSRAVITLNLVLISIYNTCDNGMAHSEGSGWKSSLQNEEQMRIYLINSL